MSYATDCPVFIMSAAIPSAAATIVASKICEFRYDTSLHISLSAMIPVHHVICTRIPYMLESRSAITVVLPTESSLETYYEISADGLSDAKFRRTNTPLIRLTGGIKTPIFESVESIISACSFDGLIRRHMSVLGAATDEQKAKILDIEMIKALIGLSTGFARRHRVAGLVGNGGLARCISEMMTISQQVTAFGNEVTPYAGKAGY
jgi:hypothetical protein